MLPNAFIDQAKQPTEKELTRELGESKALWDALVDGLAKEQGIDVREWNSYSKKAGWSLKLKRGERTIVYLSPCKGCFRALFALGEKALSAARKSGLPAPVLKTMREAKRYAEGTAVRIEVRTEEDIEVVKKLAEAKRGR